MKDNGLPFEKPNPNPVPHLRDELSFEMHGDSRIMELVERETLGLMPKMIQVPFALLKEAVSQILTVEASELAAKAGAKVDPKTGTFKREWLPIGLQRKMQVADILHNEAEKELDEAKVEKLVDEMLPPRQVPGFDV